MALYERELQFLCDTFRRNHVPAMILSCHDPILSLLPAGWNSVFGGGDRSRPDRFPFLGNASAANPVPRLGQFGVVLFVFASAVDGGRGLVFGSLSLGDPLQAANGNDPAGVSGVDAVT